MNNNEFKTYHPIVNFTYFALVIGFAMVFMHPVSLVMSFSCAFFCSVLLRGSKAVKQNLMYMLPTAFLTAALNPMFNHEGATILMYLPSGNPLTLESISYGLAAALMLVSVICWFSCFSEVMTSDKFVYLFGRIIPSLSLVLSMTLRFVPQFIRQIKETANAQKCIGRGMSGGSVIQRAANALSILSIVMTRALENSIETADSMKARGYGIKGRTAFSIFAFDRRDCAAMLLIVIMGIYIIISAAAGGMNFEYFPLMCSKSAPPFCGGCFVIYAAMCLFPILVECENIFRRKI